MNKILSPYSKNGLQLKNHLVMAPMTRSRAIGSIPNELMAEYYGQRTGAGLIVTEGTAPAPEGLGYARIPGVFNQEQVEGWKKVTAAVHEGGSKIFIQLMHTGRVTHKANLPQGATVVGASDKKAEGKMWTDSEGMQDNSTPRALTTAEVKDVVQAYVQSSKNAIEAGFDGIELHGANGYLIEQFLNPTVNTRTDEYGGGHENRARFAVELARQVAEAIGKEKVGMRISPYNTFNDMGEYDAQDIRDTYVYLVQELNKLGIAYVHINNNPKAPKDLYDELRSSFDNTLIFCGGLKPDTAEQKLDEGFDLVAFASLYLANPDLDKRIEKQAELNKPDQNTFYTPGPEGYIDYPTLQGEQGK